MKPKHRGLCLSYPHLIGVSHFNPMTSSPCKPPVTPILPPPLHPPHPTPFIPPFWHPSTLRSILVQTLLSTAGTKHGWIMAVKCHRFFIAATSSPRSAPGPSPRLTINHPAAQHLNMEQWTERGNEGGKVETRWRMSKSTNSSVRHKRFPPWMLQSHSRYLLLLCEAM